MSMNQSTVIEYASDVWSRDTEQISTKKSQLLDIASNEGFDGIRDDLYDVSESAENNHAIYYMSRPRPILKLLGYAISDLVKVAVTEQLQTSVPSSVYTSMGIVINQILLPMLSLEIDPDKPVQGQITDIDVNTCSDAEQFFADTVKQVNSGRWYHQKKITTYTDSYGEAVALRKSNESSSAVTLKSTNFKGIVFPPGMIVGVNNNMNNPKYQIGEKQRANDILEAYEINGPLVSIPRRLSAYAFFNPLDRALFAAWGTIKNPRVESSDRVRLLERYTLQRITNAADRVVNICDPKTLVPKKSELALV
jgi:hypothetical protein